MDIYIYIYIYNIFNDFTCGAYSGYDATLKHKIGQIADPSCKTTDENGQLQRYAAFSVGTPKITIRP
jgi:hypothetical protein